MKAHLPGLTQIAQVKNQVPLGNVSSADVARDILQAFEADDLMADTYEAPASFHESLREFLSDQTFYFNFRNNHSLKKDLALSSLPSVLSTMTDIARELPTLQEEMGTGAHGRIPLIALLRKVGPLVYAVFPEEWATFGYRLMSVITTESGAADFSVEGATACLFSTSKDVDIVFSRRSALVMLIVNNLMCGDGRITQEDCGPCPKILQKHVTAVGACELRIPLVSFEAFWFKLLTCVPDTIPQVLMMTVRGTCTPKKVSNAWTCVEDGDADSFGSLMSEEPRAKGPSSSELEQFWLE